MFGMALKKETQNCFLGMIFMSDIEIDKSPQNLIKQAVF